MSTYAQLAGTKERSATVLAHKATRLVVGARCSEDFMTPLVLSVDTNRPRGLGLHGVKPMRTDSENLVKMATRGAGSRSR